MWIWTRSDADIFRAQADPALVPGVLAATVELDSRGALRSRLGLSPTAAGRSDVALVFRLEDTVHRVWEKRSSRQVARELGSILEDRIADAEAGGARITEIQLDYDAPVRRLAEWTEVVAQIAEGPLRGREIWLTSVPAHLEDPQYGARLAGHVRGHILQLFDTGLRHSESEVARVGKLLERQPLAFRVGVAYFERRNGKGKLTDHAAWREASSELAELRRFGGIWAFPAGREAPP